MRYPIVQRFLGDILSDDAKEDIWNDWLNTNMFRPTLASSGDWTPKMDIDETEKDVVVSVSIPGMDKKNIKIDISDNVLTVSGERKDEEEKKGKNRYIKEQFYGSFKRSVRLPFELKSDGAKANYKDGILKITIPKSRENKTKSITVE